MGVAASASISIVKDGILWGLIACHNNTPRSIPLATRTACQALGNALARQIRSKEETELYRERIRLRAQEDAFLRLLGGDGSLEAFLANSGPALANLLTADGFAAVQGKDLFKFGKAPDRIDVRRIAEHVRQWASRQPFVSSALCHEWPDAADFREQASGLLAVTMSTEVPTILMLFRAEHVEVLKWAGNPHKSVAVEPGMTLQPRAAFEAWAEEVKGRAPP